MYFSASVEKGKAVDNIYRSIESRICIVLSIAREKGRNKDIKLFRL